MNSKLQFTLQPKASQKFGPIKITRQIGGGLEEFSGKDIHFFHTKASLKLKPGNYKLPITEGNHLLVEIKEETVCNLFISTAQIEQKKEVNTIITDFELEFTKPIILDKVLPILATLPEIFDDNNVEEIKNFLHVIGGEKILKSVDHLGKDITQKIENTFTFISGIEHFISNNFKNLNLSSRKKEVSNRLEEKEGSAIMPLVYLEKVKGKPIQKNKHWNLDLSFSGKVNYLDTTIRHFKEVKLPYMIIPALHAELGGLFSHKPLSSARLKTDIIDVEGLCREFFRFTESFSGEFVLEGLIPRALLRLVLQDHSQYTLRLFNTDSHHLSGNFVGKNTQKEMCLNVEDLKIQGKTSQIQGKMEAKLIYKGKEERLPVEAILSLLQGRTWGEVEAESEVSFIILEKSYLDGWSVNLNAQHPDLLGEMEAELNFSKLFCHGQAKLVSDPGTNYFQSYQTCMEFSGEYGAKKAGFNENKTSLEASLQNGFVNGRIQFRSAKLLKLELDGMVDIDSILKWKHPAIPELDIQSDTLQAMVFGKLQYHLETLLNFDKHNFMKGNIRNSSFGFEARKVNIQLNRYTIDFPSSLLLTAMVKEGKLDSTGLGNLNLELVWDLEEQIPILRKEKESIPLFYKKPRKGRVNLLIGTGGKLDIVSESKGMFDGQIFSAILYPEEKFDRWLDTLENPIVGKHFHKLSSFFSKKTGELIYELRKIATLLRKAFKRENVTEAGDIIPYKNLIRVFTRFSGRKDLEKDFKTLLQQLLAGRGLSKSLSKSIFKRLRPETYKEYKNEIHKIINILSTLVEPILLNREKRKRKLSITEESDFSAYLSANEIYASLEEDRWTEEFHEKLENIAHYLRISQLEWILKQNPYRSSSTLARHLLNVYNLKQRIHLAREQFGGLAYLPQEIYINFFLSDLSEILSLQDLRPENKRRGFIRKGYIGPSEAAILLQAILSSPFEGRNVQLNLKYLFELISRKEEKFLQFTLIELSDESVRVLTQLLYRLFNFRQDILKEKLDFREIFERGLGLQIPIKKEIENTISKSYYQQLSKLATKILKNREEYDLIKKYIQIYKYSEYPITISPEAANLEKEAIDSIAEADTYAAKLSFNHRSEEKESAAIKLYEKSFKTCTKLLDLNPRAFQLAWFKKFWHRNHEALVILTVVRNYQKNIDSVRNWLHVQSGKSSFHNEQVLLETIIDVLYKKNKDKETLKNDPLVRLLIDPAPGKYDFSIVSCMGIITYGSEGTELEETFERLKKKRGIETYRTDTKIMRSLRSNARWIEKTIEKVKTPFGLLGYSQGCANALTAEALMRGGTPDQRKKMEYLKSRNFLYGATNGSVHGDTANLKYFRFTKQIELLARDYKRNFSPYLQELMFEAISLLMVSRRFVHITGGMSSVSSKASINLALYGQFDDTVPSSSVRGVVDKSTLPEANEMLSNLLSIQSGNKNHDTQVEVEDAVPYFTHADTKSSRLLKKNDMGSFIQATHHWAPLFKEVDFLTTERDLELAIYDTPKDRHVFPWIEVNARFGIIKRK